MPAVAAGAGDIQDHRAILSWRFALLPGQGGQWQISQVRAAERCQHLGPAMTMLYGFQLPGVLRSHDVWNFLDLLRARGVIRIAEGGKLAFDDVLTQVALDAQLVLQEQIASQGILQAPHAKRPHARRRILGGARACLKGGGVYPPYAHNEPLWRRAGDWPWPAQVLHHI